MCVVVFFFFFKQKTAYEMRISDWSSDVCSSDLSGEEASRTAIQNVASRLPRVIGRFTMPPRNTRLKVSAPGAGVRFKSMASRGWEPSQNTLTYLIAGDAAAVASAMGARPSTGTISQGCPGAAVASVGGLLSRSEEQKSELQSLMRI